MNKEVLLSTQACTIARLPAARLAALTGAETLTGLLIAAGGKPSCCMVEGLSS